MSIGWITSFPGLPFGFGLVNLFSSFGHEARTVKVFMAEGYCVKCKAKREIANGVEETMKNGRKAIKGKCPTCGTVMFKILGGKAAAPAAPAAAPVNLPTS
jgi:Zn finger protein HypA/HybF involved in hydrogenase expression